jgi:hypothetical protein
MNKSKAARRLVKPARRHGSIFGDFPSDEICALALALSDDQEVLEGVALIRRNMAEEHEHYRAEMYAPRPVTEEERAERRAANERRKMIRAMPDEMFLGTVKELGGQAGGKDIADALGLKLLQFRYRLDDLVRRGELVKSYAERVLLGAGGREIGRDSSGPVLYSLPGGL